MKNQDKITFIDLFAGIGGFHYALHQLGCECVFASEINEAARETYKKNYYNISPSLFDNGFFNDDIRKISAVEIPDFDILCAGFPCQPFSQAGYKKGFSDGNDSERGNLFFNILDIIEAKKPKAFFLENVRGIITHDKGRTFKVIRDSLERELEYSFYYKIVKATDYGLPQHRPRAFMIGFRDEGILKSFQFPPKIPLKFNMSDVFEGNCSREIGFTLRVGGAGSNINDRRNWDSYLVDNEVVRIQPKHALKIQGFPENFILPISKTESMKQLGNSVAVDAIKACAKSLIEHFDFIHSNNKGIHEMKRRRNKGEWTELYTFLKLIVDKKLLLSDDSLKETKDFFNIKKITTLNINQSLDIESSKIILKNESNSKVLEKYVLSNNDLNVFRNEILSGTNSFEIEYIEKIFNELGIEITNGGNSLQKSDIVLDVEHDGNSYIHQGFGIKSYLGSKPTLLNASGSNTNFIYEIKNFKEEYLEEVNSIDSRHKIKDRISFIFDKNCEFNFLKVESDTMNNNLLILDDGMPALISKMLINFYTNRVSNIDENLKNIFENDPYFNKNICLVGYQIKIKRFLVSILLGMFSGKPWNGKYLAKGSIVVKQDGSQLGFHIVKLDVLENYLFNTIKFDTPSTKRHRFASVYKEKNGKFYFKLNLQLRY